MRWVGLDRLHSLPSLRHQDIVIKYISTSTTGSLLDLPEFPTVHIGIHGATYRKYNRFIRGGGPVV